MQTHQTSITPQQLCCVKQGVFYTHYIPTTWQDSAHINALWFAVVYGSTTTAHFAHMGVLLKGGDNDVCPVTYSDWVIIPDSSTHINHRVWLVWCWNLWIEQMMMCRNVEVGFTLVQTGTCCWFPVHVWAAATDGVVHLLCSQSHKSLFWWVGRERDSSPKINKYIEWIYFFRNHFCFMLIFGLKKRRKMFIHSFIPSFPAPFNSHAAHFLCKWDVLHRIIFFRHLWILVTLWALNPPWDDLTCCKLWKIVWICSQMGVWGRGEFSMHPKYILWLLNIVSSLLNELSNCLTNLLFLWISFIKWIWGDAFISVYLAHRSCDVVKFFLSAGVLHNSRDQSCHSAANFMGTCCCTQFCFRIFDISRSTRYCVFVKDLFGAVRMTSSCLELFGLLSQWTPGWPELGNNLCLMMVHLLEFSHLGQREEKGVAKEATWHHNPKPWRPQTHFSFREIMGGYIRDQIDHTWSTFPFFIVK